MSTLFNLLGWLGAFILVGTYFLVTLNKIGSKARIYHLLNIIAGLALGVSSYYYGALFSVALNTFWVLIASFGLFRER